MRRVILRHAFVFLAIAFALGLVAGVTGGNKDPGARLWLASHTTGLLVCFMVGLVGLTWPELRLGRRGEKTLYVTAVPINYLAMVNLGVLAPLAGVAPPIIAPRGIPAPPAWAQGVVNATLVIVTISSFVMTGLILYGLRGGDRAASG